MCTTFNNVQIQIHNTINNDDVSLITHDNISNDDKAINYGVYFDDGLNDGDDDLITMTTC